jgi:glycosyltransferase involved in cell wall biosynthesis
MVADPSERSAYPSQDSLARRLRRMAMPAGGRVLQLSKFYPPVMGGIETVAWELTEGLNRAGVRTDVLCSHQQPRTVVDRADSGYRIVRAASMGRLLSTSMAPSMVGALRRMAHAYDVVHLHMPDPMAALALFAVRPRARLVVHWHSDVIRQRFAMHAYRHLQDWVLRRADAIIATSAAYAESSEALRRFRRKIAVVPIGISASRYQPLEADVAAIRAMHPGKRLVFSLGRMTHYKGFDVLIRAARALPEDVMVLIGGDGELLEPLRRQVTDQGLQHKVRLIGHVPDHTLAAHFAACDVFCMPSTLRAEAYGVAIVEAMASGKPVVATDIGGSGVPWVNVHRRTGLNVPVGDPDALAAGLCTLLADDGLRRHYGGAALQRFAREFRADRMIERMLQLYEPLQVHASAAWAARFGMPSARMQPARPIAARTRAVAADERAGAPAG